MSITTNTDVLGTNHGEVADVSGFRATTGRSGDRPNRATVIVTDPRDSSMTTGSVVTAMPCPACAGWHVSESQNDDFLAAQVNITGLTNWSAALLDDNWNVVAVGEAEYLDDDRVQVTTNDGDVVVGVRWVSAEKVVTEQDWERYAVHELLYRAKENGFTPAVKAMNRVLREQAPHLMPPQSVTGSVRVTVAGSDVSVNLPNGSALPDGQTADQFVDAFVAEHFPTGTISRRSGYETQLTAPDALPRPTNPSPRHIKTMDAIVAAGDVLARVYSMCGSYESSLTGLGLESRRNENRDAQLEWEAKVSGTMTVDAESLSIPEGFSAEGARVTVTGTVTFMSSAENSNVMEGARRAAEAVGIRDASVSEFVPNLRLV